MRGFQETIPDQIADYLREPTAFACPPFLPSPLHQHVREGERLPFVRDTERVVIPVSLDDWKKYHRDGIEPLSLEVAGGREQIAYEPSQTRVAIVTCGGLCPGLNDVIRGLVLNLYYHYGVKTVDGIRYGYRGLVEDLAEPPIRLEPDQVEPCSDQGGTIIGTSRGNQDPARMVDFIRKQGYQILFTIGGDGTQRGAHAISLEAERQGYPLSVIGLPKTIDNDILLVDKTFGFDTAVSVAARVLDGAHVESKAEQNGVVIVKLMGRQSGFLATYATLASGDVNFLLIPEIPFDLDGERGFFSALKKRLEERRHAVVVVAEGVAENLMGHKNGNDNNTGKSIEDDIGLYLRDRIKEYFKKIGFRSVVRYIDPSYLVRSLRANASDSIFCQNLARHAVHAAMSGRTRLLVASCHDVYAHYPFKAITAGRKFVDPQGRLWTSAIGTTGQPISMKNPTVS